MKNNNQLSNIKILKLFYKSFFYILVGFFLFINCESEEVKYKKALMEYEKKVEQELSKNQNTNEIFMTFKLGDTKQTVEKKFRLLIKQNKIKADATRELYYVMDFFGYGLFNARVTFSADYYDNKLYKFILIAEPKQRLSTSSSELLFNNVFHLYYEKYGFPQFFGKISDNYNPRWIENNREIRIKHTEIVEEVRIIYTDKRVEKLADAKEKKEKEEKTEKLLNNI